AQKPDLVGWVRGDNTPTAEVANELARLSHENSMLRSQLSAAASREFDSLTFKELIGILRQSRIPDNQKAFVYKQLPDSYFTEEVRQVYIQGSGENLKHAGDLFEIFGPGLSTGLTRSSMVGPLIT